MFRASLEEARAGDRTDEERAAVFQQWRREHDFLHEVFPDPEQDLSHDELQALARGLEKNRKLLTQVSLVQYRCGAMRPNGKPRGCLLGAVLQTQGQRLWVNRQALEVDTISSDDIEQFFVRALNGEVVQPWGDISDQVLGDVLMATGDIADWEPQSLSEYLRTNPPAVVGPNGLELRIHRAREVRMGGYRVLGMNCRHVEHHPTALQLVEDMKRVRGARNKTVYITP